MQEISGSLAVVQSSRRNIPGIFSKHEAQENTITQTSRNVSDSSLDGEGSIYLSSQDLLRRPKHESADAVSLGGMVWSHSFYYKREACFVALYIA